MSISRRPDFRRRGGVAGVARQVQHDEHQAHRVGGCPDGRPLRPQQDLQALIVRVAVQQAEGAFDRADHVDGLGGPRLLVRLRALRLGDREADDLQQPVEFGAALLGGIAPGMLHEEGLDRLHQPVGRAVAAERQLAQQAAAMSSRGSPGGGSRRTPVTSRAPRCARGRPGAGNSTAPATRLPSASRRASSSDTERSVRQRSRIRARRRRWSGATRAVKGLPARCDGS